MRPDSADDRQRLEQALRQSHERFQVVLNTTLDGYWRVSLDGHITDVNDAYCRMSGYSRAELLDMTVLQVEALDDDERLRERAGQLQREGMLRFLTRHRAKDGRLLDLEIGMTLIPSTQEVVVILRDLTERNRAQEALFETQRRFKALVQHSWDILSILDAEGHLIYKSPACERIHGFTPEELLGLSTVDLIHPDDAPRVSESMGWLLAHPGEPTTVEYRYACKDGHWVWMEAVGVNFLDHPAIRGIVVNSRDITDRRGAQEALQASEWMYRELLEHQGEGFGMVDAEERFVFSNPVAESIFGVPPGGLQGRSLLDFLDEAGLQKVKMETQERLIGRPSTYELEIRRPSGEVRTILVTATPRPMEVNAKFHVIGVFRDITEARRAEIEREQYFKLFNAASDLMAIADPNGCFKHVNPSLLKTLGYEEETILAKPFIEFVHPEDRQKTLDEMAQQLNRGFSLNFENRFLCKDGAPRWLSWQAVYVASEGITYATARDITELKLKQAEVDRLNGLLEQSQFLGKLGGWELDLRTQALYWTEETYRIADTSPEAFKPSIEGALGFYAPEYREVIAEAVRGAIEDGRPYELELEMITTKGGRIWVHTNGRPVIENGRTIKVLGMVQDITERKQAEGALRYEKERLARIYQGSYDAIFVSDLETGRYLDVNDAWERITGYPREEVLGRNSMNLDLWINPDDRSSYYKELQADNHVRNRLIHIRHRLGHDVWAECNSSVMEQDGRRCMVSTARDVTERIQAEIALHDSEEKFRRMLEAASIPIGIADIKGKIEYLNPRFIQDLAYNREDLPDMATWWLRAYPDPTYREEVLQIWHEAFARAQASGGDANMEQVFHLTCGDGQIRQVEIRAALAGSRAIVFIQDITARVRSEESLRDALELSDRLVSSQPMGIVSFHAESGACVRANEAMARMLGATVSQLMGHKFWDLPSWQESGLLAAANRALATESEQHVEGRILTIFGKPFWFSAILSTFHAGGDLHLLVVCEDITARKEAESALRKAYAAVEQSPAMILITDRQGAIEYVNEAFTRMSGYTFEEAMGRNPRILNSGLQDAALYKDLWNTVLDGQTWTGRLQNRRKDGQLFWSEAIISPLRNEAGEITHLVSSSMDITELLAAAESRQRLEEQVARTQKLESLGSLAGGVAHDMNNVLGAIMGLASVHQMIEPEGSALRKDMDTIVKACERGGTLVKGLLGFARKGLAEEQDVDLNNLVREEVALLSRTTLQRVQLKMDLTEDLLVVRGDASALSHLLMNLCVNAVDAMPDGGVLTLHTSPSGTGFVVLEVSDSGCGMSKDVLDKALDPFFTTKPQGKGTGLGLPIVYGTVKAHKGRMEIDSVPGQGTRVRVFLPAISREAESKAPPRMLHDEGRHLDVLVVDDDELVQDSLMQLLSALGHRSTVVNSGEQALLHLEANLPTDVVILDLNMPGQGGAATLPQIRKLLPHLPVLLATGRVDQDALDLLRKTPGVTLMPKPFNLADLRQHLEPFCGG